MLMTCRAGRLVVLVVTILATSLWAGCSLEDSGVPALTSPSGFSTAVTLTASPDRLPRDGSAQAIVTVTVRDAANSPVPDQRLSVVVDIGSVSESEVVTDGDGHATFAYVAPESGVSGGAAVIRVVPIGANADAAISRTLTISFTGAPPSPAFTVTPSAPVKSTSARFDASTTTDEGAACPDACAYSWNFGDGSTGTGRIVDHAFASSGTYTVILTVTDASGASASSATAVTVSNVVAPTVTLAVTPNPPLEDHPATFTATATPATGHGIVRYAWTFGDDTSATTTGPTVTKTYDREGTFVVNVTVTDDIGQTASTSLAITVGDVADDPGTTGAWFTFSPTNPEVGDTVRFDASASRAPAGATITEYDWNFGDGETASSTDATTTHVFTSDRTFLVRLTVTYSNGDTGIVVREVTVAIP